VYEASSYADGGPGAIALPGAVPAYAATSLAEPPRPQKLHWATLLMVAGVALCGIATLATIAGLPASIGYDEDGAADRNKPSGSSALALTKSIDGNMKYIDQVSADTPGAYVGYIKSINRSEASIAGMTQALGTMAASVDSIDAGLTTLEATTEQMNADMSAMSGDTATAAATMQALSGGVGGLSGSMLELATATEQLTERMASIQAAAADIARNGIARSKSSTAEINAALPNGVPAATLEDGTATKLGAFDTTEWRE
jgi:hypothetical protein